MTLDVRAQSECGKTPMQMPRSAILKRAMSRFAPGRSEILRSRQKFGIIMPGNHALLHMRALLAIIAGIAVLGISLSMLAWMPDAAVSEDANQAEAETLGGELIAESDIVMPIKSSRPGCEEGNQCYIPHIKTVKVGHAVSWMNQDVAFHSVTSGAYEAPSGLFDSGHMEPGEVFSFAFSQSGRYDYFCTLHPWMAGIILVE